MGQECLIGNVKTFPGLANAPDSNNSESTVCVLDTHLHLSAVPWCSPGACLGGTGLQLAAQVGREKDAWRCVLD